MILPPRGPGALLGTLSHVHTAQAASPANTVSSCPSDLASSGNDRGALTAQGGGEGEHSQSPDILLGNADKERNAGAAVSPSSAGPTLVASCHPEPRSLAMEPGLWRTCLGKAKGTFPPKK